MLHCYGGWAHDPIQSRYRVDEFRRILPKTGTGLGLVQFWGAKARSKSPKGPWTIVPAPDNLHTVEINTIVKITDQRQ